MRRVLAGGCRRLATHKKGVVFAYIVNLLVASALLLPFMRSLERSLGAGLYRDKLFAELDYDWLQLFSERVEGFASSFSPSIAGFGPFARNLSTLLDGGLTSLPGTLVGLGALYLVLNTYVLAAFTGSAAMDPNGSTTRDFLRTGGEFLGRFFRLSLMSIATFLIADLLLIEPGRRLVQELSALSVTDRGAFLWSLSLYLLTFVLFVQINMIFDYAKIITAVQNRTSAFLSLFSAVRFVFGHWAEAVSLYVVLGLIGVLGLVVVAVLDGSIPQDRWTSVLLVLIVQQAFMVFRLALKLGFYATQMEFFVGRSQTLPGTPTRVPAEDPDAAGLLHQIEAGD